MKRARIAITMGDPCGIGPEIIIKQWGQQATHDLADCFVVGDASIMRRAAQCVGAEIEVVEVASPEEVVGNTSLLPCLQIDTDASSATPGQIDPVGGQAAYESLVIATELALAGRVDGITTAPLNKAALNQAGHDFPGHTELLGHLCQAPEIAMMLYLPPFVANQSEAGLGVVHVTLHMALKRVFDHLCKTEITAKIELADTFFRCLRANLFPDRPPRPPQIGVCALNPHAGEEGLFGSEERRIILPAVRECQAEGLRVEGPFPSDTLMAQAADGAYDAVVAMYHDQGHIALKLLGMHKAVNVTLGLPIVRTSVAHGTAFDQAWRGTARSESLWEALQVAARLGQNKPNFGFNVGWPSRPSTSC